MKTSGRNDESFTIHYAPPLPAARPTPPFTPPNVITTAKCSHRCGTSIWVVLAIILLWVDSCDYSRRLNRLERATPRITAEIP